MADCTFQVLVENQDFVAPLEFRFLIGFKVFLEETHRPSLAKHGQDIAIILDDFPNEALVALSFFPTVVPLGILFVYGRFPEGGTVLPIKLSILFVSFL